MERHLRALAAAIPAAPGDPRSAERVVVAFDAIKLRLQKLSDRINDGEDAAAVSESAVLLRQLATQGDRVAALCPRLAASEALLADVYPNPAWTLLALCRTTFSIQLLLQDLERRQTSGPHLSSEQLAGLLAWPAAVIVAAPVVLPSARRAVHDQLCGMIMSVAIEHLHTLAARSGESAVHAAALAEARRQLPALVRACAHAAGRLAMPSQEEFCPEGWAALLHFLGLLVDPTTGYQQAAAAALTADGPGGKPGKQLAAHLLAFLTSLAEAGPPASCCAAPAAEAAGAGAAEAVTSDSAAVACWEDLLVTASATTLKPYLWALATRGDVGLRLLSQLGGLLKRLHEQQLRQQAVSGAPGSLPDHAVHAQLVVFLVACTFTGRMLGSYSTTLDSLLPPESERCEQLQGSLVQAVDKGLQYVSDAVRAVRHAAAVLLAAARGLGERNAPTQARFVECCHTFGSVTRCAGVLLRRVGQFTEPVSAEVHFQLLAGAEAALRAAPTLQRCAPPADMHLPSTAALCAVHITGFFSGWEDDSGEQLAAAEAEALLHVVVALTATACKVAVLHTLATGEVQPALPEAAAPLLAGPAAAGAPTGGGRAAPAAAPGKAAVLASRLLATARYSWELAQVLVQRAASSEQCNSLLRCVCLHQAEMASLLLPLCPQGFQDSWKQDVDLQLLVPLAQQHGNEAAASLRALAAAGRCCHMGCTNLEGSSDAGLNTKRCSGCRIARFCSGECSKAAWRAGHKQMCRLLAAGSSTAGGEAAGNA